MQNRKSAIERAIELSRAGHGYRKIAQETGITEHEARAILTAARLQREVNGEKPDEDAGDLDELIKSLSKNKDKGIPVSELLEHPDDALERLAQRGMTLRIRGSNIVLESSAERLVSDEPLCGIFSPSRKSHKFVVISDSHIGGFQAQPHFLKRVFEEAEAWGASVILHAGDHMDGSPKMHAGFTFELGLHSADQQVDFTVDLYRQSGVPIVGIGGNHDGSWFKDSGLDVCRMVQERTGGAYTNIGPIQGWLEGPNDDPHFIRLFHPGDGCSYALSYKDQKTAEYLAISNDKMPSGFHFTGHYHKFNHMRGPNGARYFLVPSSCGVTPFMKAKRLINSSGALFIEYTLDKRGQVDRCHVHDFILHPEEWVRCDYSGFLQKNRKTARSLTLW